jgi:Fe2+ transport system protein FeoA
LGLGLHSGSQLIILQRRGRGMVVAIGAARVALGNDVAGLLQVEALD